MIPANDNYTGVKAKLFELMLTLDTDDLFDVSDMAFDLALRDSESVFDGLF